MSIDWLYELERALDGGKEILACPAAGPKQWAVGRSLEELRRLAQRAAANRKTAVRIVRLIPPTAAAAGEHYLVPTRIAEPDLKGVPQIEWATVETKEAAELMRDLRHGPAPYFGMQVYETIEPPG